MRSRISLLACSSVFICLISGWFMKDKSSREGSREEIIGEESPTLASTIMMEILGERMVIVSFNFFFSYISSFLFYS